MSALADGVRLAWGTLTAIPGPAPSRVDADVARAAMVLAWLVVLPVTLLSAGLGGLLVTLGAPPLAAALLSLGALQWATNGLHADGLADTADALWSGRDTAGSLEIMRRGDVGPMGVTALVLVLGAQAALLGDLLARPAGWLCGALTLAFGRLGLTLGTRWGVPAARADGLGKAMAGVVPAWLLPLPWLAAAAVGAGASWVFASPAGVSWWAWPAGLILGAALANALLARARRRLGGITGDVLGALVETTTLGVLLGLALG
ncbi:MAG: adenosylcobinamide-GDP ribazoletransferase [Actinomycetes bacterium]